MNRVTASDNFVFLHSVLLHCGSPSLAQLEFLSLLRYQLNALAHTHTQKGPKRKTFVYLCYSFVTLRVDVACALFWFIRYLIKNNDNLCRSREFLVGMLTSLLSLASALAAMHWNGFGWPSVATQPEMCARHLNGRVHVMPMCMDCASGAKNEILIGIAAKAPISRTRC